MNAGGRISVDDIAARLSLGRLAIYKMLEDRTIPAIRLGRRWIITWHAYLQWEATCGKEMDVASNADDIAA
jgi:excisionase family DNA binding protein